MALNEASEQSALTDEALQLLLEEEEREKAQLKEALQVAGNRGKRFHEVSNAGREYYNYIYHNIMLKGC